MKKFLNSAKYAAVGQLIIWIFFVALNEMFFKDYKDSFLIMAIIVLILLMILYIIISPKMIKREKMDKIKFHASFMVSWVIFTIIYTFCVSFLEEAGIINQCVGLCILDGIEYLFLALGMIAQAIITPILLCIVIYFKPHRKDK